MQGVMETFLIQVSSAGVPHVGAHRQAIEMSGEWGPWQLISQHSLYKAQMVSSLLSGWLNSDGNMDPVFPHLSIFHEKLKIQIFMQQSYRH